MHVSMQCVLSAALPPLHCSVYLGKDVDLANIPALCTAVSGKYVPLIEFWAGSFIFALAQVSALHP